MRNFFPLTRKSWLAVLSLIFNFDIDVFILQIQVWSEKGSQEMFSQLLVLNFHL